MEGGLDPDGLELYQWIAREGNRAFGMCRAPWTGSIGTRSSCAAIWRRPFSGSSGSRVRDCSWEV